MKKKLLIATFAIASVMGLNQLVQAGGMGLSGGKPRPTHHECHDVAQEVYMGYLRAGLGDDAANDAAHETFMDCACGYDPDFC